MKLSLTALAGLIVLAGGGFYWAGQINERVARCEEGTAKNGYWLRWHGLDKAYTPPTDEERRAADEAEWYGHMHGPAHEH